jgi:HK97 gp10 family phage protein
MNIVIRIDAERVAEFFRKMPGKMKDALDSGIKKSAAYIEAESKKVTPVDTGRLRASIHSVFGRLRGEIGTNTNYAIFVHEGTTFMRSRPFMSWGIRNAENDIKDVFKEEISRALR